jgi:hypothetical protein
MHSSTALGRSPALVAVAGLAAFACLTGCAAAPEGLDVRARSKSAAAYSAFGKPIVVEGSRWVVIPFVVEPAPGSAGFSPSSGFSVSGVSGPPRYGWSGSASGSGFVSTSNAHWNNLVFHDPETGTNRLVLDHRAVIMEAFFPTAGAETPGAAPGRLAPDVAGVFLVVADADTNGDGYLNSGDASVLYRCDLSAANLTALTPAGTQFQDFTVDARTRSLYARFLRDGDGSHKFDYRDKTSVVRVDLTRPGMGVSVLDPDVAARAAAIVAPRAAD